MAQANGNVRVGKEGNRWYNQRPGGEDIAEWFKTAIELPDGLSPEHYVAGVVLIPGKEKSDEPWGFNQDGLPMWREVENLVYTPYMKVETRIKAWHDWMAAHPDWLGVIEPVEGRPGLPPGFSRISVDSTKDGKVPFVTATMKATVYDRKTVKIREFRNTATGAVESRVEGTPVMDPPPANKMVPVLNRWKTPDPHAFEKAETGAIGRALGMAGVLVIPGTGVATAEDMQQALSQEPPTGVVAGAEAPTPTEGATRDLSAEPTHEELVTMTSGAIGQLKKEAPALHTAYLAWVRERGFDSGPIGSLKDAVLKQLLKRAEEELAKAKT